MCKVTRSIKFEKGIIMLVRTIADFRAMSDAGEAAIQKIEKSKGLMENV